ncbi:MAG TPA: hypothetical protein QF555_03780 [Candidatus Thalassarchaeaceae archaeon]|jgi:hypothetical protein|nr:hypothetical protein [Candidatus Thalassarchaeaceae archaeon]
MEGADMYENEELDLADRIQNRTKSPINVSRIIWYEFTGGVGPWGALRPLIAIILALVPFLFLGQHFNREHAKGRDWFLLQIPLLLSIVLWPILWLYSIIDAWWVANNRVAKESSILNLSEVSG